MFSKKLPPLAGLALLGLSLGLPAHAQALTLEESLTAAYAGNPAILSARNTAEARERSARSAWGDLLPTLEGTSTWGGTTYDHNGQTDTVHPRTNAVTLSQPLFTGGETFYAARAASATSVAARADADTTTQNILLQTVQAYTSVLKAQAEVSATASLVEALTRQTDAAAARLEAGEGTTTDLALTTARQKEAEGRNALAHAALVAARQDLESLTGQSIEHTVNLAWPSIPASALTEDTATDPAGHPQLKAAMARLQAAEATRKSTRGAMLPNITATASAGHNEDTTQARTSGTQYSYQLALSVPLFNGFSNYHNYKSTLYTKAAAENDLEDTRRQVVAAQVGALHNLMAARANTTAAEAALKAQEQYTAAIQAAYGYGESSLLDTLDATGQLAEAQSTHAAARATYINSYYAYLQAHGQLTGPPVQP